MEVKTLNKKNVNLIFTLHVVKFMRAVHKIYQDLLHTEKSFSAHIVLKVDLNQNTHCKCLAYILCVQ